MREANAATDSERMLASREQQATLRHSPWHTATHQVMQADMREANAATDPEALVASREQQATPRHSPWHGEATATVAQMDTARAVTQERAVTREEAAWHAANVEAEVQAEAEATIAREAEAASRVVAKAEADAAAAAAASRLKAQLNDWRGHFIRPEVTRLVEALHDVKSAARRSHVAAPSPAYNLPMYAPAAAPWAAYNPPEHPYAPVAALASAYNPHVQPCAPVAQPGGEQQQQSRWHALRSRTSHDNCSSTPIVRHTPPPPYVDLSSPRSTGGERGEPPCFDLPPATLYEHYEHYEAPPASREPTAPPAAHASREPPAAAYASREPAPPPAAYGIAEIPYDPARSSSPISCEPAHRRQSQWLRSRSDMRAARTVAAILSSSGSAYSNGTGSLPSSPYEYSTP